MEQKFAYKGTDKDMKCRDVQFELGKTYFINHNDEVEKLPDNVFSIYLMGNSELKTCTKKVIHYCNEIEKIFPYYSNNGKNRFFKVEILGDFVDDSDGKSGTRCIKFVEEISADELKKVEEKKEKDKLDISMRIDKVKELQILNPNLIIGGSIALYIHGVRLKRFKNCSVDYDLMLPYFQVLQGNDKISVSEDVFEKDDADGTYESDFETCMSINGVKADVRIDPKQRYEIVKYNDFDFKVTPLETIIEAKARYAKTKWGEKHKDDLREMILKK